MADEEALWDLRHLAQARGLCDWMFEQFSAYARGRTVEVGAGIGTFSERLLAHGVPELMLLEPEAACVAHLRERFGSDPRVTVVDELLPEAPSLLAWEGTADFVLCQNVLEHIAEESGAVKAMADALAPGGVVTILVPAHPRLYGRLDERYGHERRYTRKRLARVIHRAGLELVDLYSFNALGIAGWLAKSFAGKPSVSRGSLRAYERMLPYWRAVEDRRSLPVGLSLVAHARKR